MIGRTTGWSLQCICQMCTSWATVSPTLPWGTPSPWTFQPLLLKRGEITRGICDTVLDLYQRCNGRVPSLGSDSAWCKSSTGGLLLLGEMSPFFAADMYIKWTFQHQSWWQGNEIRSLPAAANHQLLLLHPLPLLLFCPSYHQSWNQSCYRKGAGDWGGGVWSRQGCKAAP